MKVFGSLKEVVALVFRKTNKEVTIEPAAQSGSGPITLTIPDVGGNAASFVTTTAPSAISVNASSDAFKVTQLGSGNAFVVEDSSPDSTPFVIDSNGKVGIGSVATPFSYSLEVDGTAKVDSLTVHNNTILKGAGDNDADIFNDASTITMGTVTGGSAYNIGTGATTSSNTKTVNLGTGGLAGSTTNINIGSAAGNGTVTINENTTLAKLNNTGIVHTSASGALSTGPVALGSEVSGTLPLGSGGTGATSAQSALNNLVGTQASGQYLRSNGTNTLLSAIQDADLPSSMASKTLTSSVISSVPTTSVGTGALKLPVGNSTSDRPVSTNPDPLLRPTELKGMIRYNDTDDVFEGYNELSGWSSIGGGGTTDRVTQASHGFAVGDTLYLNGSTYTKAIATSAAAAEVVGVVSRVIDSSTFEITLSGEVSGLAGLTTGEVYFLSAATAGALTTTEPSVIGQVSVPVGVASSASTLYVAPKRGMVVGGSNARTEINLTNVTTPQNIQDMSSYEAVEITGWVYIDATTDLRFYVAAQVSRGGSGVYNISYQTSGDTPPTGFSLTVTNPGQVQLTLSSGGVSGFASAKFNYALNAPAVGASFPLSVDSTQVNFNTIKAKDATGLVFQENGGTTTGTVSDAGAWTLGMTSAGAATALSVKGTGSSTLVVDRTTSSGALSGIELQGGGTKNARILSDSTTAFTFESSSGATLATATQAGAWTFLGDINSTTGAINAIGTTNTSGHNFARSVNSTANAVIGFLKYNCTVANARIISVNADTGTASTARGYIRVNATSNGIEFEGTSDRRIKQNIENLSGSLEKILNLQPRKFEMKEFPGVECSGFIAQEFAQTFPEAVTKTDSGEGEELPDGISPWTMSDSGLTVHLVKAIQELKAELDATKAEIAELKNK